MTNGRRAAVLLGFAVAVFLGALLSGALRFGPPGAWPYWIPSGLAAGAALVAPRRLRPACMLVLAAAIVAAAPLMSMSVATAASIAVADVCEAALMVLVTCRVWRGARFAGGRLSAVRFFATAAGCAAIGTAVSSLVAAPLDGAPIGPHGWVTRAVADTLGILTIAPPIVL